MHGISETRHNSPTPALSAMRVAGCALRPGAAPVLAGRRGWPIALAPVELAVSPLLATAGDVAPVSDIFVRH